MRALLVTAPRTAVVADVPAPEAAPGLAVVRVDAAGVCGTDSALFEGEPDRIAHTRSTYPLRLGHEWTGTVVSVGSAEHEEWVGRRVVGDPVIGCLDCDACSTGMQQLCLERWEVGVRRDWAGAFAEQLTVPVRSLHALPDEVGTSAAALVEPAANAWRALDATGMPPRILVIGAGTIGILAAQFAQSHDREVTLLASRPASAERARHAGVVRMILADELAGETWDAVVDASNGSAAPAQAVAAVRPGGVVSLVGVSDAPSLVDTRALVRGEKSVRAVMGGSAGFAPAIAAIAAGHMNPAPLIHSIHDLDGLAEWLNTGSRLDAPHGTKVLVHPGGADARHRSANREELRKDR